MLIMIGQAIQYSVKKYLHASSDHSRPQTWICKYCKYLHYETLILIDYANQSVTLYNTQIEQNALKASWEDVHLATFGLNGFFIICEYLSSSSK